MFTHLHVHTEYSLLDGLCRINQVIARAKALGMTSMAITDHGSMHGVIDFYIAAREAGIKPIIGCEVYVAPADHRSKSASDKNPYHLTLLAKNQQGYRNLIQLVSKSHLAGFYYKPRVDKELLSFYHEGIIALSGCLHGQLSQLIIEGRIDEATSIAQWYKNTFDDYYVEIQRHPIRELERANLGLLSLAAKLNIPIVATNDVHYVNKDDAAIHELLLCIQTNTSIHDEKRMKMAGEFFYLKSPEEMSLIFADLPQALENTQKIADMCQLELEFGKLHLPKVAIPEDKTADEYLAELCWQGFKERFVSPSQKLEQRLTYEMDVIQKTHFADYFLVVWDLISFVRKQNILFGVRGSAAASLALYCLNITDIDPVAHKLVFERFLNIERRELPDIDLDFQDDRRDEVISYINQKYGTDRVAQIITFGTMGARAAIRDVGRALGMPYSQADRVARLIPQRPNVKLEGALTENRELQTIYQEDDAIKHLIGTAIKLEGVSRHASTHAAGVVISREPLAQYLPLQRASSSKDTEQKTAMTQFSMDSVARLGLLKLDILGLANLTLLAKAKDTIANSQNISIDLQHIPLNDPATFKLLSSGETSGIFQLEGDGMRRNIKELKPTTFTDIAAMVALYRPGPMEHIPRFIRSKYGLEAVRYSHPALKDILEETYGIIVYQDQVLLIVQALAGYSLGQADVFRKAMGKKIPEVMQKERNNFINGAKANGISEEVANEIFALIEPFAGYAFNKAHAVSYAMIAYETAYIKANFPVEYMTALMNTYAGNVDKIRSAIAECRRINIPVLPPDINRSNSEFIIEKQNCKMAIRFSLTSIKNVGSAAIEAVISIRSQKGDFKSIEDFCRRADLHNVNRKVLESLIKAGAFDCLAPRGSLLQVINQLISLSQREQQLKESGQASMFDLWGSSVTTPLPTLALDNLDAPLKEKLEWERALLGVYFSEHPFAAIASKISSATTALCGQVNEEMVGETVVTAGVVNSIRQLSTKDKRPFIIANLEDLEGSVEITVWSDIYEQTKHLWQEGEILLVEGKVKLRDERITINCYKVRRYQTSTEPEVAKPGATKDTKLPKRHKLTLTLKEDHYEGKETEELTDKVMDILTLYPGEDSVHLVIINSEHIFNMELPTTRYCTELAQKVTSVLGNGGLKVEEI
jgi:DNA polymerase-3 subunit alpha